MEQKGERKPHELSDSTSSAYILVSCILGYEEEVINALKPLEGVKQIDQIYGIPYDLIVKVTSGTGRELELVIKKIRSTKKIKSTQTMLVARFA